MSTDPTPTDPAPGAPESPTPGRRSRTVQPRKTSPAIAQLALRMQEDENLTYDQIATRLAVSRMTVARLLAAAREMEDAPETDQPQEWTLPRSGAAPLQFLGTLRTKASSEFTNVKPDAANEHFWTIAIYDITEPVGRISPPGAPICTPKNSPVYVVTIDYHKRLHGQAYDHFTAQPTTSIHQTLADYDPLVELAGFPPAERFAPQQCALEMHCKRQWETLMMTVLAGFPVKLDVAAVTRKPSRAASSAINELGEAARPFVALQTPEAARLATAVRAVSTMIESPDFAG